MGFIEDIRTPDGETARVDREGTVDTEDSQTRKTVERGAIGAPLGAIIGAVAGGGKGAAIGAVIGAGAGAGSVIVGGRDRLDLPRGTEVTITSGDSTYERTTPDARR
jgi:outer membrane lipoprotein SlyB